MVQIMCNIHQLAELCQRKFSEKSGLAQQFIYLNNRRYFGQTREKPARIELNDASVLSAAEVRRRINQFNYTAMEASGRSDMHSLQPTL
jgi:hypothetical protein